LPPSGLKIDASPSLTSNQSLPRASIIFGLVRDENIVLPVVWDLRQHAAQCFRTPSVLVRRYHEAALRQVDRRLDFLETRQHGSLVSAIEPARLDLPDGYSCRPDRRPECLGKLLALVIEIALLGGIGQVEWI
jgi:hypothetical protein